MSGGQDDAADIRTSINPLTGERLARATLTPQSDQRMKNVYLRKPAVIPIVFLPGIMGSNLKIKGSANQTVAWRPPNGLGSGIAAAFTWIMRGPRQRQQMLNLENVEVDERGEIAVGESGLSETLARRRGWGAAHRSSYHRILALLQQRLNEIAAYSYQLRQPGLKPWWGSFGLHDPREYGEQRRQSPLTTEEMFHAARFQYDVWCAGYNWLQSNRLSGLDVKDFIENRVLAHYRRAGVPAEKVILVTHSMGGLVARALTELHGYDKVLGVIHGVMPATGAPLFYQRMRAGYEGPEQIVLGRNAGEVTAVVANAPGALGLAPSFDHDSGRPWLFFKDARGNQQRSALPSAKNPYQDIYKSSLWYGLVPASNSRFLNMSRVGNAQEGLRKRFELVIDAVRSFHLGISGKYHVNSYSHYGADSSRHSWQTVLWEGGIVPSTGDGFYDDRNGRYVRQVVEPYSDSVYSEVGLRLKPHSTTGGDGTVPETSGVAPGASGVAASFRHGNQGRGSRNANEQGYEHQHSYNDRRAQWATLFSVVRLSQRAFWYE